MCGKGASHIDGWDSTRSWSMKEGPAFPARCVSPPHAGVDAVHTKTRAMGGPTKAREKNIDATTRSGHSARFVRPTCHDETVTPSRSTLPGSAITVPAPLFSGGGGASRWGANKERM